MADPRNPFTGQKVKPVNPLRDPLNEWQKSYKTNAKDIKDSLEEIFKEIEKFQKVDTSGVDISGPIKEQLQTIRSEISRDSDFISDVISDMRRKIRDARDEPDEAKSNAMLSGMASQIADVHKLIDDLKNKSIAFGQMEGLEDSTKHVEDLTAGLSSMLRMFEDASAKAPAQVQKFVGGIGKELGNMVDEIHKTRDQIKESIPDITRNIQDALGINGTDVIDDKGHSLLFKQLIGAAQSYSTNIGKEASKIASVHLDISKSANIDIKSDGFQDFDKRSKALAKQMEELDKMGKDYHNLLKKFNQDPAKVDTQQLQDYFTRVTVMGSEVDRSIEGVAQSIIKIGGPQQVKALTDVTDLMKKLQEGQVNVLQSGANAGLTVAPNTGPRDTFKHYEDVSGALGGGNNGGGGMGEGMSKLLDTITGPLSGRLGKMLGVGGLFAGAGIIGEVVQKDIEEGKIRQAYAQASMNASGDTSWSADSQALAEQQRLVGADLHMKTHGFIDQDETRKEQVGLMRDVMGHYNSKDDWSDEQDMGQLAKTSVVYQNAYNLSSQSMNNAIKTFYKELSLSAGETEFVLAKLASQATALNIPFEKHMQDVMNMAVKYKDLGLSVDDAANVLTNFRIGHGMNEAESLRAAQSVGNALGGMDKGTVAFSGMMFGGDATPYEAIWENMDKWDLDENGQKVVKKGWSEKHANMLDSMITNIYAPMGGGDENLTKMIIAEKLMTDFKMDQMTAVDFTNAYASGDKNVMANILEQSAQDESGGPVEGGNKTEQQSAVEKQMDDMVKKLSESTDHFSFAAKNMAAVDLLMRAAAAKIHTAASDILDFSGSINKITNKLNNTPGAGNVTDNFGLKDGLLYGALGLAALGGIVTTGIGLKKGAKNVKTAFTGKNKTPKNTAKKSIFSKMFDYHQSPLFVNDKMPKTRQERNQAKKDVEQKQKDIDKQNKKDKKFFNKNAPGGGGKFKKILGLAGIMASVGTGGSLIWGASTAHADELTEGADATMNAAKNTAASVAGSKSSKSEDYLAQIASSTTFLATVLGTNKSTTGVDLSGLNVNSTAEITPESIQSMKETLMANGYSKEEADKAVKEAVAMMQTQGPSPTPSEDWATQNAKKTAEMEAQKQAVADQKATEKTNSVLESAATTAAVVGGTMIAADLANSVISSAVGYKKNKNTKKVSDEDLDKAKAEQDKANKDYEKAKKSKPKGKKKKAKAKKNLNATEQAKKLADQKVADLEKSRSLLKGAGKLGKATKFAKFAGADLALNAGVQLLPYAFMDKDSYAKEEKERAKLNVATSTGTSMAFGAAGAALGAGFGGVGAIPGFMIGATIGGVVDLFSNEKVGDFVNKHTGLGVSSKEVAKAQEEHAEKMYEKELEKQTKILDNAEANRIELDRLFAQGKSAKANGADIKRMLKPAMLKNEKEAEKVINSTMESLAIPKENEKEFKAELEKQRKELGLSKIEFASFINAASNGGKNTINTSYDKNYDIHRFDDEYVKQVGTKDIVKEVTSKSFQKKLYGDQKNQQKIGKQAYDGKFRNGEYKEVLKEFSEEKGIRHEDLVASLKKERVDPITFAAALKLAEDGDKDGEKWNSLGLKLDDGNKQVKDDNAKIIDQLTQVNTNLQTMSVGGGGTSTVTTAGTEQYYGNGVTDGNSVSNINGAYTGKYAQEINASAKKHGIDPWLIASIIKQESGFDPNAESGAGAQGLMQLMPATARGLGVKNAWDPAQNIDGGTKYIAQMLKQFSGDLSLALAAYNAGPGRAEQWIDKGRALPEETQNYIKKVMGNYRGSDQTVSNIDNIAQHYLDYYSMSSGFGMRDGKMHKGIDLNVKGTSGNQDEGTQINALKGGTVKTVKNDKNGYGHYVLVDHGDGTSSRYAHLKEASKLKEGAKIKAGDLIGLLGNTGDSHGAHLHFEMLKGSNPIDAMKYIQNLANNGNQVTVNNTLTPTGSATDTGSAQWFKDNADASDSSKPIYANVGKTTNTQGAKAGIYSGSIAIAKDSGVNYQQFSREIGKSNFNIYVSADPTKNADYYKKMAADIENAVIEVVAKATKNVKNQA